MVLLPDNVMFAFFLCKNCKKCPCVIYIYKYILYLNTHTHTHGHTLSCRPHSLLYCAWEPLRATASSAAAAVRPSVRRRRRRADTSGPSKPYHRSLHSCSLCVSVFFHVGERRTRSLISTSPLLRLEGSKPPFLWVLRQIITVVNSSGSHDVSTGQERSTCRGGDGQGGGGAFCEKKGCLHFFFFFLGPKSCSDAKVCCCQSRRGRLHGRHRVVGLSPPPPTSLKVYGLQKQTKKSLKKIYKYKKQHYFLQKLTSRLNQGASFQYFRSVSPVCRPPSPSAPEDALVSVVVSKANQGYWDRDALLEQRREAGESFHHQPCSTSGSNFHASSRLAFKG